MWDDTADTQDSERPRAKSEPQRWAIVVAVVVALIALSLAAAVAVTAGVLVALPRMQAAADARALKGRIAADYPDFDYIKHEGRFSDPESSEDQVRAHVFLLRSRKHPSVNLEIAYETDRRNADMGVRAALNGDGVFARIGEERRHADELMSEIASAHAGAEITIGYVYMPGADNRGRLRYGVMYVDGVPKKQPLWLSQWDEQLSKAETYFYDPVSDAWTLSPGLPSEVDSTLVEDEDEDEWLDEPSLGSELDGRPKGEVMAAAESEYPGYEAQSASAWDPNNTGSPDWLIVMASRQNREFKWVLDVGSNADFDFAMTGQYLRNGTFTRTFERAWTDAHPGALIWEMNAVDFDAPSAENGPVSIAYFDSIDDVTRTGILPRKTVFEFDARSRSWRERAQ